MADNLSVAVTADTSSLRASLALAQADLKAFGADTRKLATDIRAGGDATGLLRGQIEQVAGQFAAAKNNVVQLTSALRDGKAAHVEHAGGVGLVKEKLGELAETAALTRERVVGTFEGIHGAFLELTALLAGGALFREIIEDVVELDERVTGLQRALGLDREEALQTDIALRLIGKTTDEYTAVILKLDTHLRTNEERFKELGVATRDEHGELKKGPELLNAAIAAMQSYKAGTDQNLVSVELFGRGARDMYGFMDLTAPIMERAKQIVHDYGVELQDRSAMIAYRVEMAALGMAWEAAGHKIADELLPVLKDLTAWFNTAGPPAARVFVNGIRGVMTVFADMVYSWQTTQRSLEEASDKIAEQFSYFWQSVKGIFSDGEADIQAKYAAHMERMKSITLNALNDQITMFADYQTKVAKINGGEGGGAHHITLPDVNIKGGTRTYSPPAKGGGGRGRAAKPEKDDTEARELERLNNEEKIDGLIEDRRTKMIEAT